MDISNGLRITVYLATMWVAKYTVAQLPFTLDTAFRTVITQQNVNAILITDDGIVCSGWMRFPGDFSNRSLAKLLFTGQKDDSFGVSAGGSKLTKWQDRFYVMAQTVNRVLFTGEQDPTFLQLNLGPYFSSLQPGDYHVYPDGRILISGQHLLSDSVRGFEGSYNLCWFSNTGYLDTTRIHRKGPGIVFRFRQLPDGGFICNGSANTFEGVAVDRIFKVDSLGVPDTTFRTGAIGGFAFDYLPLPDGRVYVAGQFLLNGDTNPRTLVRLLPDGSVDPAFTAPLVEEFDLSFNVTVSRIRAWGADKLLLTGAFESVNGQPRHGICMIDTSGNLLSTFENSGVGPFTYQGDTYGSLGATALDTANGFLYIAGAYNGYSDGVTNDPQQRFVSRLFLGDLPTEVVPAGTAPPFLLYPNPAAGQVTVRLAEPASSTYLLIRDALGRVVLERSVQDRLTSIALDHLAAGTYLLELQHNGQRSTQRLVVQQ